MTSDSSLANDALRKQTSPSLVTKINTGSSVSSVTQAVSDVACDWTSKSFHVWQFRLDDQHHLRGALQSLLSDREVQRAQRYRTDLLQRRYETCRGLVRVLLAAYLGIPPQSVELSVSEHGKPNLSAVEKPQSVQFNVSHSKDIAMFAIGRGLDIGVDVEVVRAGVVDGVLRRCFSAREIAEMETLAPEQYKTAFYKSWVRKEAYVKALGMGLRHPLNSFEVRSGGEGRHWGQVVDVESDIPLPDWRTYDLSCCSGAVAAFACNIQAGEKPADIQQFELMPSAGHTS